MKGKSRKELQEIFTQLKMGPLEDRLLEYFDSNPFTEDLEIEVYQLAEKWQENRRDLLDCFLQLVGQGFCGLTWLFHCPHCGAVPHESLNLRNAHEEDHCLSCRVDFRNELDQNVEVRFVLQSGNTKKMEQLKQLQLKQMLETLQTEGKVEWKSDHTILGSHCIYHPQFREFLGDDLLDLSQTLAVSYGTILFTDIKGSTSLYEKLGDPRAYRLVRDHFNILFHETEKNGGAVVKTIGDSVMSSFPEPVQALKTALSMQKEMTLFNRSQNEEQTLDIKIGLHSGPVILVTLNNRLDYFGTTVNKAARIQGEAQAGEILISDEIFHHKKIQDELKKHVSRVMKREIHLRGMDQSSFVFRIPRPAKTT